MISFHSSVILSGGEQKASSSRYAWPSRSRRTLLAGADDFGGAISSRIEEKLDARPCRLAAAIREGGIFQKVWIDLSVSKVLRLRLGLPTRKKKASASHSLRMTDLGNQPHRGPAAATPRAADSEISR